MSRSKTTNVSSSQLDPAMRDQFLQNVETSRQTSANLCERQFANFTPDKHADFQQTPTFAAPNSQHMNQHRFAPHPSSRHVM